MKKRTILWLLTVVTLICVLSTVAFAVEQENPASMRIESFSLSLENAVYMNFKVSAENITNKNSIKLLAWTEAPQSYTKGSEDACLDMSHVEESTGYAVFQYSDLAAKDMSKMIYVCAYAEVGGEAVYSAPAKLSVAMYAYLKSHEATPDEDLVALLDKMLAYGAMAQDYFNHNTEYPADATLYQIRVTNGTLADGFALDWVQESKSFTMTANAPAEGYTFSHWENSAGTSVGTTATLTLSATRDETYTAVYKSATETPGEEEDDGLRILFIGNSLTYYNDMPAILMNLGLAAGKDIYTEKITSGSSTLCQQTSTTTEIGQKVAAALEEEWDYVVVQTSRRITDHDDTVYEAELDAALVMDAMAKAAGAQTVIYNTWGNNTGSSNIYVMAEDGINTTITGNFSVSREEHNQWMHDIGEVFAEHINAPVVDTATLFDFMVENQSAINVYYTDKRHPSLYGSYAIACAFYDFFFEESSVDAAKLYRMDMELKVAELLAAAADHVVLGADAPTTPVIPGSGATSTVSIEPVAWSGTGSASDPYIIASAGNYMYFVNLSNEGESFDGKYIKQTADVDLKGGELVPAGTNTPFAGTYDGGGYRISDYSITNEASYVGIFAKADGATISNVVIANATFKGQYAGAIAGYANATAITNCVVLESASVEGSEYVGGIAGQIYSSTVRQCVNYTTTTSNISTNHNYVGGIVGAAGGADGSLIELCYNAGTVTVNNTSTTSRNASGGGILGCEGIDGGACDINRCVNTGLIIFTPSNSIVRSYCGGIIGRAANTSYAATVSYCYNTGNLVSNSTNTTYTPGFGQISGVYANVSGIQLEYCYGLDTVSAKLAELYGEDDRYTNYVAGKEGSKYKDADYFRLSDKLGLKTKTEMDTLIAAVVADIPALASK